MAQASEQRRGGSLRHLDAKIAATEAFLEFTRGGAFPTSPLEVHLDISNVCNQRCVMCPRFSALLRERSVPRRLHLPVVRHAINELTGSALKVQISGWGEPTIHPQFGEILECLCANEVLIEFFTNGSNLTRWASQLVEHRVHRVTVSMSGATPNEFESIYLGGSHRRVLQGIEKLAGARAASGRRTPLIEVNSLSFRHHLLQLDRVVEQLAAVGVDRIAVTPLHEHIQAFPELRDHAAPAGWGDANDAVERARRRADDTSIQLDLHPSLALYTHAPATTPNPSLQAISKAVDAAPSRPADRYPAVTEYIDILEPPDRVEQRIGISLIDDPVFCFEPFKTMYVSCDGQVKACCFMQDDAPALGSVETARPLDVWNGSGFETVRRGITRSAYPARLCGICLRRGQTPIDHGIDRMVTDYQRWMEDCFGETADGRLTMLAGRLRDPANGERIRQRHPHRPSPSDTDADQARRFARSMLSFSRLEDSFPGLMEGYIDPSLGPEISGWLRSPLLPDLRFEVDLWIDDRFIARRRADTFRSDLASALDCDGAYGFSFPRVEDGAARSVAVCVGGTRCHLPESEADSL